jgi:hypothetical protein
MPSSGFRIASPCFAWKRFSSAGSRVTRVGAMNWGNSRIASFSGWLRSAAGRLKTRRAFALGLLEQVGGVEVLAVERRVGAHQHRAEVGQGDAHPLALDRPLGEPGDLAAGERDLADMGRDPVAALPHQVPRLAGEEAVAAAGGLPHHREGRVLLDVEGLERVGDEEKVHGLGAGSSRRGRHCCTKSAARRQ